MCHTQLQFINDGTGAASLGTAADPIMNETYMSR